MCLSLLGTWAGPGWDAKTSTLLQVGFFFVFCFLRSRIFVIAGLIHGSCLLGGAVSGVGGLPLHGAELVIIVNG